MSTIPIRTAAEFFRCIGPTATLEERHAALARLVRMLLGDAARSLPPISLPGRTTALDLASALSVEFPAVSSTTTAGRPRAALKDVPAEPGDEQHGAWPREELQKMDRRFVERRKRAIARGKERPSCLTF